MAEPKKQQEATEPTYSGFPVKIEIFEGPLDLLLHLIRKQEVGIEEVQVSQITEEYLRTLEAMSALNIDLASDFLVMAANLIWLKSRALLPRKDVSQQEDLEEAEFAETEEELKQRIEEYRAYKEAATLLAESRSLRKKVFLRPLSQEDDIGPGFVPLSDVSLFDMIAALQVMLERTREAPPQIIRPAEVTVADCIADVSMRLRAASERRCNFIDLVDFPTTRIMVVLIFLATLELIRRREIRVFQGPGMNEIVVELMSSEEEIQASETDFDPAAE